MKVSRFVVPSTRHKFLAVSKNSIKIKIKLTLSNFRNFCQAKRLLHESEIVQYLDNDKCCNVDQDHFRKHLKSSTGFMKMNISK